jgi:hypothetical protein
MHVSNNPELVASSQLLYMQQQPIFCVRSVLKVSSYLFLNKNVDGISLFNHVRVIIYSCTVCK